MAFSFWTLIDDGWLFVKIMNKMLFKNHLAPISISQYRDLFSFPVKTKRSSMDILSEKLIFPNMHKNAPTDLVDSVWDFRRCWDNGLLVLRYEIGCTAH